MVETKPKGYFLPYKKEFKKPIKGKKKYVENPYNKFYCYNCRKPRHVARVCHNKENGDNDNRKNKNKKKNKRRVHDDDMTAVITKANIVGEEVDWSLDTGATRRIYGNKDLFVSYELVGGGMNMFMGNSSSSKVIEKGIVELWFTSRKTITLREVLHILDIKKNLVSGSLLSKHEFKMVFESNRVVISMYGVFVGNGFATSRMFKFNVINEMPSTSAYLIESCNLWHGRLGHVHYNKIRHIENLELITNLDNAISDKCITCSKYKITCSSFSSM